MVQAILLTLVTSLVAATGTKCDQEQIMLQTYAVRDRLSSGDFCCFSAPSDAADFCGQCWPGAIASAGHYCASESTCGGCGGTWCNGNDTPIVTPAPSQDTDVLTPDPTPSATQTLTPRPSPSPTVAATSAPTKAPTPVPTQTQTLPVEQCSDDTSDCRSTKCCEDPNRRCYEKDDYWASCKASCAPGIQLSDPVEFRTPWTCKVLGESSEPTPTTPAPVLVPTPASPSQAGEWDSRVMKMTHYWDCSGQGCDAPVLDPWVPRKYVSPPGYGPQDPADFGGAVYGEKMWLTGAASDALAALMGSDDACCGEDDSGRGGCGRCLLVQNPDSMNSDWTAVVMKKNRCPPWSSGCGDSKPHFDIAAPGFDNLRWSTANICGSAGTGFDNQGQSEAVGSWWEECSNTADCAHLCDRLPARFRSGCKLFAAWGWTRGDPERVLFRPVECPAAFRNHIGSQFDKDGVTN